MNQELAFPQYPSLFFSNKDTKFYQHTWLHKLTFLKLNFSNTEPCDNT